MAGIVGLGIDLCAIDRIERAMHNPHFTKRAFTEGEIARIQQKGAQTAAGYFAAKEAIAKALGTGFDGFFFDAIEIAPDARGCPHATVTGRALSRMQELGGDAIMLSITHESGNAAAVAIIVSQS